MGKGQGRRHIHLAAHDASSSSPSVVTRAVNQSAQPSAFGNSA
jgi:hypothetical protein